jgi:hypothetical protein
MPSLDESAPARAARASQVPEESPMEGLSHMPSPAPLFSGLERRRLGNNRQVQNLPFTISHFFLIELQRKIDLSFI